MFPTPLPLRPYLPNYPPNVMFFLSHSKTKDHKNKNKVAKNQ